MATEAFFRRGTSALIYNRGYDCVASFFAGDVVEPRGFLAIFGKAAVVDRAKTAGLRGLRPALQGCDYRAGSGSGGGFASGHSGRDGAGDACSGSERRKDTAVAAATGCRRARHPGGTGYERPADARSCGDVFKWRPLEDGCHGPSPVRGAAHTGGDFRIHRRARRAGDFHGTGGGAGGYHETRSDERAARGVHHGPLPARVSAAMPTPTR